MSPEALDRLVRSLCHVAAPPGTKVEIYERVEVLGEPPVGFDVFLISYQPELDVYLRVEDKASVEEVIVSFHRAVDTCILMASLLARLR